MDRPPIRAAYADPPYIGQARKHYGSGAREVNHPLLIQHLQEFDRWALSLSSPSLWEILPLCPRPPECRVMSWVKPFASFKRGINPAYAWEPVIVKAPMLPSGPGISTIRDWVSEPIALKKGTSGAKPLRFCLWMFQVLGLRPGDELVDLFPGSGSVASAWEQYQGSFAVAP